MSGKGRSNNSLCEKSMKMVANIVKLSSFSIVKMSLGQTEPSVVTENPAPVTGSVMDAHEPLFPQVARSRKSRQLRSRSKPYSSFVMQPDEGNGSTCVVHGENSVIDGMASDYIRKFHEKNSYEALVHETSKLSPYRPSFPSWAMK